MGSGLHRKREISLCPVCVHSEKVALQPGGVFARTWPCRHFQPPEQSAVNVL